MLHVAAVDVAAAAPARKFLCSPFRLILYISEFINIFLCFVWVFFFFVLGFLRFLYVFFFFCFHLLILTNLQCVCGCFVCVHNDVQLLLRSDLDLNSSILILCLFSHKVN